MKKHIKILKKKLKNFDPKLKEECGVFGVSNAKDASALTALGLHALQHRGQEGCGIVTFDGEKYYSEKRFGLVGDNFNKEKVLKNLKGNHAIGHNRYSTTGENTLRNIQPFFADTNAGNILFLIYISGAILGLLAAKVLKLVVFKSEDEPFVMEMPKYRMPSFKLIWHTVSNQALMYLKKAGTFILAASILIWFASNYPKHKEYEAYEQFKKADGVVYNPTAAEKEAFKVAAMPVRASFLKSSGAEGQKWLERFENEIKTCEMQIKADYDIQFN